MNKKIFSKIFFSFFSLIFILNLFFSTIIPEKVFAAENVSESTLQARGDCSQTAAQSPVEHGYTCSDDNSTYSCSQVIGSDQTDYSCVKTEITSSGIVATIMGWLGSLVAAIITTLVLNPLNWLMTQILWLAARAFDFTVYFTIVKFKANFADLNLGGVGTEFIGNSGGDLIYYLWGMLRDFLNILIFITIVYQAVRSMFNGFEETRDKFIYLLIFSIVVNFSLLFVKLSIDISNIFCLEVYTLAVKPSGVNSFKNFITSSTGNPPNDYGEYLINITDFAKLQSLQQNVQNCPADPNDTAATAACNSDSSQSSTAKDYTTDLKTTFIVQVGRAIMLGGLIYLLIFMVGLLLIRAGFLLYAMILSSFLAADIFFQIVEKGGEESSLAKGVRSLTSHMKGDFYDSLVKGPILLFFVYLIGVFATAIFNGGYAKDITGSLQSLGGPNGPSPFLINSLPIFFKFALFFALCKISLDKLQEITVFGEHGERLNKFGKAFANYTLGRGLGGASRLGALAGQNIIGRGIKATGLSNRFSDLDAWASKKLANQDTSLLGKFGARRIMNIAEAGKRSAEFLTNATYDAGNVKELNLLAKGIKGATGVDLAGQFGTTYDKGFKARQEAAQEARDKKSKERENFMKEGLTPDHHEIMKKVVNFEGANMTLEKMEEVLKEVENRRGVLNSSTGDQDIAGMRFNEKQVKSLLNQDKITGSQAFFDQNLHSAEHDAEEKAKKDYVKSRQRSKALGNEKHISDYLSPTGMGASNEIQTAAKAAAFKEGTDKTKAKELAGKISLIKDTKKTSENILNQINELLLDPTIINKLKPEELDELIKTQRELGKLESDMSEYRSEANATGTDAEKKQKKAVENVAASGILEKIIKAQDKATGLINNTTFSESKFSAELKNAQNELSRIQSLTPIDEITELQRKLNDYRLLPAEVQSTPEIQKAIIDTNSEIRQKRSKGTRTPNELIDAKNKVDELTGIISMQKAAIQSANAQDKVTDKHRKNYETYFGAKVEKVEKPAAKGNDSHTSEKPH